MRLRSIRGMFTVAGLLLLLLLVSLFFASRSAAAPGPPPFSGAGPPAAGAALRLVAAEPVTGTVQLHLPAVYKAPRPPLPPQMVIDLGTLGGPYSAAYAVNSSGQVAGYSNLRDSDSPSDGHAFRWQNGRMFDLGTLGGQNSKAVAINERGQVAGDSDVKSGGSHAFFWADGRMTDIGVLGGTWSQAVALNNQGVVAGISDTASGRTRCFVWATGVITDLGTLGGDTCIVTDINDRGQVVGASALAGSNVVHAFLWEQGTMIDLSQPLSLEANSSAAAINERGLVAGSWTGGDCKAGGCAVLWDNGATVDLSAAGEGLNMVEALNDRDEVAGYGNYEFWAAPYGYSWDAQLWVAGRLTYLGVKRGRWPLFNLLLNNRGQVVISDITGTLLWQDGSLTPLFAPDGGAAYAADSDDAGHVAGYAEHALLWNITLALEVQTAD